MAGISRVAVIGAGWSGATCARLLTDAGVRVEVFERAPVAGGHSRAEVLHGVVYEPNGPHIFHTSDPEVAAFVHRFGLTRPYELRILTEGFLDADDDDGVLLSWPLQVDELRDLPIWPAVVRELAKLPDHPTGDDFPTFVTSMMGPTLYRIFVEGYTRKQWGCEPAELSADIARHRVVLRRDGDPRTFRDRWEFFPERGVNEVIERVIATSAVTFDAPMGIGDLDALGREFDAVIVTAALDEFVGEGAALEWRGISVLATFVPTDAPEDTVTPAYLVNRPTLRVAHTRTCETKHASGQQVSGTVVSEELPGAAARHYPISTVDHRNERANSALADRIRAASLVPVHFVGRLAQYAYINQDEAIRRAMDLVHTMLSDNIRRSPL